MHTTPITPMHTITITPITPMAQCTPPPPWPHAHHHPMHTIHLHACSGQAGGQARYQILLQAYHE